MFGLLNIRSMTSKFNFVYELIMQELDIFVLTETWHGSSDDICLRLAMPPGYDYVDFLRPHDPYHGGLVIYFRSQFKCIKLELPLLKTFEAIAIKFVINRVEIVLLAIYRPGSVLISSLFFHELTLVLEQLSTLAPFVMLAGDFNVHVEKPSDPHTINLLEIFELFGLYNRITEPTHVSGGTLDLIVSSSNLPISSCNVHFPGVYSDHSFIEVCLPITFMPCVRTRKLVRSWSRMDEKHFVSLLSNSPISKPCESADPVIAMHLFDKEIKIIVNEIAPQHWVMSRRVHCAP